MGEIRMNKKILTILTVSLLMCGPMLTSPVLAMPPILRPYQFIKATLEGADPRTVDPALCYDTASAELIMNCYDTLMFFDGERMDSFLPQIAESWTIENIIGETSPEGLPWYYRYTYKIRTDVPYHNDAYGYVTPADVEYCFERLMVMDMDEGPAWTLYEPLLNGSSATYVSQTYYDPENSLADRALIGMMIDHAIESDATYVWFNLAFPGAYAQFTQILCQPWTGIYPKQWCLDLARANWDGVFGTTWWDYHNPQIPPLDDPTPVECGAGPFMLTTLDRFLMQWTAAKFDNYWRGWPANWPLFGSARPRGYVKEIVVSWAWPWAVRNVMFLNGDVDFCAVPRNSTGVVLGQPGIRSTYPLPSLALDALFFNFDINPDTPYGPIYGYGVFGEAGIPRDFFGNAIWGINNRKAFAYAFNYTGYLANATLGEAIQPATAIIPGLPEHDSTVPRYTCNPSLAAAEFMAVPGLWNTGFNITVAYNQGNLMRQTAAQILKTEIEALNPKFHVMIMSLNWSEFLRAKTMRCLSAFISGWQADYPDSNDFANPFYYSFGAYARWQGYSNPAMDALVETGARTPSGAPRTAVYRLIQLLAISDCPSVPLSQPMGGRHFEQSWVVGWYYNPLYGDGYWTGDETIYFYPLWKWYYTPHSDFAVTPPAPTANYLPYDVNYDGKTNMIDIGTTAASFGAIYGPPMSTRWIFRCDFNNDRKIDMKDIGTVAKNFGKTSGTWTPPP
jgi:peptide/nickel transport system substrate-binding protein